MTIAPSQSTGSEAWSDTRLLYALEEAVETEINRHLTVAKEWMPHEYVPWTQGRDFDGCWAARRGRPTSRRSRDRPDVARGQPAHRGQPAELPPRDRHALRPRRRLGHLGPPLDRRGGPARASSSATTCSSPARVDPVELERAADGAHARASSPTTRTAAPRRCAYVSFQELATRISHRNTGRHRRPARRAAAHAGRQRTRTCT